MHGNSNIKFTGYIKTGTLPPQQLQFCVILYPCCGNLLYTGFGDHTGLFPRRDNVTVEGVKFVAVYNYFWPHGTLDYLFLCANSKFKITYG